MSIAPRIAFDESPRIDRVTLAIGPVDGVSGLLIRRGATALVAGLADRPIVNASGLLVFLNLPDRPQYEVEVDARRAGFPFIERVIFTLPPPASKDPCARRRDVVLSPGPDYPFPPGTTLIRGVVARGGAPVAGASIAATPAGGSAAFHARTVANGAFALPLRLPPLGSHEAESDVAVTILVAEGADSRSLVRPVENGRSHSFLEPIDLGGGNDPGFFAT